MSALVLWVLDVGHSDQVVPIVVAILGSGALGTVVAKRMSRGVDDATAGKIQAEAKQTAQQTVSAEINDLRSIISEFRAERGGLLERVARLEENDRVKGERIKSLEERERHMLTRAAVHEGWVQAAYPVLLHYSPDYPPPPRLIIDSSDDDPDPAA